MVRIVANGVGVFLEKIERSGNGDMTVQDVATVPQVALIFRGRQPRELAALIGQMRLIEEPARLREPCPVDPSGPLGERVEMTEAENAAKQLRRETHFSREDRNEPSMAEARLPSHIPD